MGFLSAWTDALFRTASYHFEPYKKMKPPLTQNSCRNRASKFGPVFWFPVWETCDIVDGGIGARPVPGGMFGIEYSSDM